METVDAENQNSETYDSSQAWQEQFKTQVGHVKTFIETNAKEHPVLFFIGAFAVGYLASKPRMLGMLGRGVIGLASASGIGLKINPLNAILKSFDGREASSSESTSGARNAPSSRQDPDHKSSTHH